MKTFIEDYVEYATEFTDAPPIVHERIALMLLSTAVNRKAWIVQGHKQIFPNLWMIVIAPSSFYRKSYSLSIGENILRKTGLNLILPREFSHEAFIDTMAEQSKGLLIFYEFKTFMDIMNKDYMAGTKSILTELYDCPEVYDRKIRGAAMKTISNPFLNILSATTLDWMVSSLKDGDMAGGFLPRFLTVKMPEKEGRSIAFQKKADYQKELLLVQRLKNISEMNAEMEFTKEAIQKYEDWYYKYEEQSMSKEAILQPFMVRMTDYCKKFAILYAINRGSTKRIESIDIEQAIIISGIFSRGMEGLIQEEMTFDRNSANIKRVQRIIRDHIGDGITYSELLRKTHMVTKLLNDIVGTLIASEIIEKRIVRATDTLGREIDIIKYDYNHAKKYNN